MSKLTRLEWEVLTRLAEAPDGLTGKGSTRQCAALVKKGFARRTKAGYAITAAGRREVFGPTGKMVDAD